MTVFLGLFVFLAYALTQALREARRQREAREFEAFMHRGMEILGRIAEHVIVEQMIAAAATESATCARRPQPATTFERFLSGMQGDTTREGGPCSS